MTTSSSSSPLFSPSSGGRAPPHGTPAAEVAWPAAAGELQHGRGGCRAPARPRLRQPSSITPVVAQLRHACDGGGPAQARPRRRRRTSSSTRAAAAAELRPIPREPAWGTWRRCRANTARVRAARGPHQGRAARGAGGHGDTCSGGRVQPARRRCFC